MKKPVPLGERLRYEFDKSMAAGPIALIGWLARFARSSSSGRRGPGPAGIAPEGGEPLGFVEALGILMRTLDAGTMGGDAGWGFRLVMLLVTLGGIFVVSTLIGVLSSGIEGKLDELRKGRSLVLESDHTIILNWSPSIFDIISELVIANESRRRPRIVIMADKDKVEMEDEIAAKVPTCGNTASSAAPAIRPISTTSPSSARRPRARSSCCRPRRDDPDSQVIKTMLALVNDPDRRRGAATRSPPKSATPKNAERRPRSSAATRCSWCSPTT